MIKMNLKEVEHIRRRTSKYSVSGSKRCNKSSTNDNDTMSMKHLLLLYMQLENYVMWQLHLPYNIQNATYLKSET